MGGPSFARASGFRSTVGPGIAFSDDDGETWHKSRKARWPRGSGFEQVAFVMDDGLLYSFGISEGRWSDVRLRRVEPARLEPERPAGREAVRIVAVANAHQSYRGLGGACPRGALTLEQPA